MFRIKYISVFISLVFIGCNRQEESKDKQPVDTIAETNNTVDRSNSKIEVKTFTTDMGWGYDIYMDGKLMIRQGNIPAIQGKKGFSTEAKAMKTAELMVSKIRKGIMPPAVTPAELDSLKVLE